MKKIHGPLVFCADWIDIIANFAVIMNAVIKRAQCIKQPLFLICLLLP